MTIQSLDTGLLLFLNHTIANSAFDVLMPAFSLRGYLLVIPFLLAMLLISANKKQQDGTTFLAVAVWAIVIASCAWYLSGLAGDALKIAFARERPCRTLEHAAPLP